MIVNIYYLFIWSYNDIEFTMFKSNKSIHVHLQYNSQFIYAHMIKLCGHSHYCKILFVYLFTNNIKKKTLFIRIMLFI